MGGNRRVWITLFAACALLIPNAAQGLFGSDSENPADHLLKNPVAVSRSCVSCHTIGQSGSTVGPNLNQVGNRRSSDWLRKWLRNPSAVKPGTAMPNFGLTEQEIESLVTDLSRARKTFDQQAIIAESPTPDEAGRRLFEVYDCYACHRIGQKGRYNGPDLTWVGKWQDMNWEAGWLADPDAHRPGTFMPNFKLSPGEIKALTAFLGTLKGQTHAEDKRWADPLYRSKPVKRGELIFEKLGCRGCHGERGTAGGFRNPNAAPNEMVPALADVSKKYSIDQVKQIILTSRHPRPLDPAGAPPPLVCPAWSGHFEDTELNDLIVYVMCLGPQHP
ncbi:MAG: c-type cytochrome [Deltaproteobacteria bacterium]|nr:c-type cytochrome [Deltaproteobacteria bacterium]